MPVENEPFNLGQELYQKQLLVKKAKQILIDNIQDISHNMPDVVISRRVLRIINTTDDLIDKWMKTLGLTKNQMISIKQKYYPNNETMWVNDMCYNKAIGNFNCNKIVHSDMHNITATSLGNYLEFMTSIQGSIAKASFDNDKAMTTTIAPTDDDEDWMTVEKQDKSWAYTHLQPYYKLAFRIVMALISIVTLTVIITTYNHRMSQIRAKNTVHLQQAIDKGKVYDTQKAIIQEKIRRIKDKSDLQAKDYKQQLDAINVKESKVLYQMMTKPDYYYPNNLKIRYVNNFGVTFAKHTMWLIGGLILALIGLTTMYIVGLNWIEKWIQHEDTKYDDKVVKP